MKSFILSLVSYGLLVSYVIRLRLFSPHSLSTSPGTSSSPVALLALIFLIASTSLGKCKGLSCLCLLPLEVELLGFLVDWVDCRAL